MSMQQANVDPGAAHLEDVLGVGDALRDHPDEAFIRTMRTRYPTEREFDVMLTRKMERRALPRARSTELSDFSACLDRFLHAHVDGAFEVTGLRWMTGGGSKIQLAFSLNRNRPGLGPTTTPMVIRMEPQ